MVKARPPMRLADPGSTWTAVTPPATARSMVGSCGQNASAVSTSGVLGALASLPSSVPTVSIIGYTPMCECVSMRPGVTNLPAPSITIDPVGAGRSPSATTAILPLSRMMVPPTIVLPVPSMSVAPWITTGGDVGTLASHPSATDPRSCHGGGGRMGRGAGGGGAACGGRAPAQPRASARAGTARRRGRGMGRATVTQGARTVARARDPR